MAKGAGDVMILAMNVVGDGSANGDVFRSRRYREKKAARDGEIQDFSQSYSRLAAQDTSCRIEGEQAVHAKSLQQHAIFEQADITIAPAGANGQQAGGWRVGQRKVARPVQEFKVCLKNRV